MGRHRARSTVAPHRCCRRTIRRARCQPPACGCVAHRRTPRPESSRSPARPSRQGEHRRARPGCRAPVSGLSERWRTRDSAATRVGARGRSSGRPCSVRRGLRPSGMRLRPARRASTWSIEQSKDRMLEGVTELGTTWSATGSTGGRSRRDGRRLPGDRPRARAPVALKLIAPELAPTRRFRERFLRESRLAASLDHPHVLPVYEAGEAGGRAVPRDALCRRHGPGRLLAEEGRLEPERALALSARSPTRSTPPTGAGSCTATSSRRTCSSTPRSMLPVRLRPTKQPGRLTSRVGPARRHARLPRPRADPRAKRRRRHRRVRARVRPLRVPPGRRRSGARPRRRRSGAHAGGAGSRPRTTRSSTAASRGLAKDAAQRYETWPAFVDDARS